MAWAGDFMFLRRVIAEGVVTGPVLEIGSLNHQGGDEGNAQVTCERAGLQWEGADMQPGPGVDLLLDLLDGDAVTSLGRRWNGVLLFNLLEHVYDPVTALRNATKLVKPGGTVVVSGPAIWELHDYPGDYWRPMPGFFLEFARREGLEVVPGSPTWMVNDRLIPLEALREGEQYLAPSPRHSRAIHGRGAGAWVRTLDRAFRVLGRRQFVFPFCSFGIALRRPDGIA
jgi:SAM-dependent methyltransferase